MQQKHFGKVLSEQGIRRSGQAISAVIDRGARFMLALVMVATMTAVAPIQPQAAYAAGVTYYVAKTGSDTTGNGTLASPWATIQKAANTVGSGDTVRVAAGTYNERVTIPATKSGVSGATTKFIADGRVVVAKGIAVQSNYTDLTGFEVTPGNDAAGLADYSGHVEINGSYNTLTNINVHDIAYTGSGIAFGINSAYNTVNGFKVSNVKHYGAFFIAWWDSPKGVGAHHNVLKNGTINNFGGNAGVNMAGANNTLDGVEVYGPSGWNNYSDGDGIRFIGPNMTVRNSKVHILQENDPLGTNQPHTDQMQFWKFADGLLIEDSVIGTTEPGRWDALKGSCLMAEVRSGDSVTFTIRNSVFLNTDAASYGGGLTAAGAGYLKGNFYNNVFWTPGVDVPSGSVLRNNVFKKFKTETAGLPINSDYNVFVTGSTVNPNEGSNTVTVADPGFVNPDISSATRYGIDADWRPKSTSVMVDRGDANYAPTTDKAGVTRDSRPDIGAYEYVAAAPTDTTAPTVAITAPTNGSTVSGSVALAASASDNVGVARVEFRADGVLVGTDVAAPFTATWNAASASPGTHSIQARAFDAAGNLTNASVSVTVPAPADTTAPVTTATVDRTASASGWYLTTPLVTLAANESAVTYYQWDSVAGDWSIYNGLVAAPQGVHTLNFYSKDAAGNVEARKSMQLSVDTSAPQTPSVVSPSHPSATTPTNAADAQFDFVSADSESGLAGYSYTLDRLASTTPDTVLEGAGGSASIPVGSDGVWYFHVRARDNAGNWSAPTHRMITVDRTAPAAPVIAANASATNVQLAWSNPGDAVATRVVRSTLGYPTDPNSPSATLVYEGLATTVTDSTANNGTTYYYAAFSRDLAGNWSAAGRALSAATAAPEMSLRLTSSASSVRVSRTVTFSAAHLVDGVQGASTKPVTAWTYNAGTWQEVGTAYYNSSTKMYEYKLRVRSTTTLRMKCNADAGDPVLSNSVTVSVVK